MKFAPLSFCVYHYLLIPRCRVLPEQLTGLQLVKKFPAFHGTPRFITALTNVRHLSLSWASPIQSIYPHPTSWRSILILSIHLRLGLPSGSFPPVSPPRPYTPPSPHPYAPHARMGEERGVYRQDALISQIYFWNKILHVSVISSAHHQQVFHCIHSNGTCHTPDDEQRNRPKHAEFCSKNRFQKSLHLVTFIIRIF